MQDRQWHTLSITETLSTLCSSSTGLDTAEARRRLAEFGPNEVQSGHRVSKLAILWAQIKNPLVYVLLGAAAVSVLAGKTADAVVIGVVIAVNSLIGYFQEYRAESALEALKAQAAPEAEVVRDCPDVGECVELRVPTTEIVPGDVILLDAGTKVPADARLVEAANLEVEEAMLTGESLAVRKSVEPLSGADLPLGERTNLLYGGTVVTNGRGRAVVYATGARTEMGKIATLIQETDRAVSPLQLQTADLGKKLGFLALAVAVLTVALGLLRGLPFQEIFLFALASAVSSIPEGLPAVMSITLAVGVNRMAKRNAIIRRLPAVDTLGAATVICTDKTGTLTTNQMTVQQIAAGGKKIHLTGVGFAPVGQFERDGKRFDPTGGPDVRKALQIGALCNDARLVRHQHEDSHTWEIRGDPTEGALVVAAAKSGYQKHVLESQMPRVDELPFSSEAKLMATFHRVPEGRIWVYVKGAPETVLQRCPHIHENGRPRALTPEDHEGVLAENHQMASGALRVLGLAYQVIEPEAVSAFKEALEYGHAADLVFVGLVGMMDPPRPEVPEAVARCKRAGIKVMMATGDHKVTGAAIAQQVGILEEGDGVLTGPDLRHMNDAALDAVIERTAVFARVAPEHKHRIVESLQRMGHVVAMTGDGVNDAPALQAAQIGVSMGVTGTDVTKETAEMVLTDDTFSSIVNAVEEGRVIFQNVRKVVKFLLATNIGEDITLLASLVLFASKGLIITPVQILWVNLVTDGILDITLAMEPKENDVMDEPPRRPGARIIDGEMVRNIVFVALFMAAGTLWMFSRADRTGGLVRAQTLAFTTLAMFQVFNSLNCRSRTLSVFQLGFFRNRYLIGAIAASIILQLLAEYVPFMQRALGTVPLTWADWGLILLVSSTIFVADELRKAVKRRRRRA
ncbi:MAG: HAD-IC family P-type ATPase [Anaerolineae bacterium]|nr:HAD-IC family P-type ATPase [Anaerolineae bacterium]